MSQPEAIIPNSYPTQSPSQSSRPPTQLSPIPFYPINHSNLPPPTTKATLADFPSSPIYSSAAQSNRVVEQELSEEEIEYLEEEDVIFIAEADRANINFIRPYIPPEPERPILSSPRLSSPLLPESLKKKLPQKNRIPSTGPTKREKYLAISNDVSPNISPDQPARKLSFRPPNSRFPILPPPKHVPLLNEREDYYTHPRLGSDELVEEFLKADREVKNRPNRFKRDSIASEVELEEKEESEEEESEEEDDLSYLEEMQRMEERSKGKLKPLVERAKRASTNYSQARASTSPISIDSNSSFFNSSSPDSAKKSKAKSKKKVMINTAGLLKELPARNGRDDHDIWADDTVTSIEVDSSPKKRNSKRLARRRKKSKANKDESEEEDPQMAAEREKRLEEYRELENREFEIEIVAA